MKRIIIAVVALVVAGRLFAVRAQSAPKQAVVETSAGTFVIDLSPDSAPNQTAYFMKLAADGAYARSSTARSSTAWCRAAIR